MSSKDDIRKTFDPAFGKDSKEVSEILFLETDKIRRGVFIGYVLRLMKRGDKYGFKIQIAKNTYDDSPTGKRVNAAVAYAKDEGEWIWSEYPFLRLFAFGIFHQKRKVFGEGNFDTSYSMYGNTAFEENDPVFQILREWMSDIREYFAK